MSDEYIRRDTALRAVTRRYGACRSPAQNRLLDEIRNEIRRAPAADVVEVVHGRWLKHYRSGLTVAAGFVSSCCDMWAERRSNCCPYCGAMMEDTNE